MNGTTPLLKPFRFCPQCGSERFIDNNVQSKRCLDCGLIYYINPKAAVVALITNEQGDILVCRRAKDPARGTLDLPGGFTDLDDVASARFMPRREISPELFGLESIRRGITRILERSK